MKAKTTAASISLLFLSMITQAQPSYTEIVETQRFCEQTGELWREVKESDTIMGKPLKKWSAEHQAGKYTDDQFNHFMMIFIYASSERFRTGHDAYMAGWARCMDDAKRPKRRAPKEAPEAAVSTPGK